jgi:hypothetical protein
MKKPLLLAGITVALAFAAFGARTGDPSKPVSCDAPCTQSSLLRIGMNLEVSERVRKGDVDGALRLLNTMNVLEVTPMLQSSDEEHFVEMKRRIFQKLLVERSRLHSSRTEDEEAEQLNRDIDNYLRNYQ